MTINGSLVQAGDYWLPDYDQFFFNLFSQGEAFESDLIHRTLTHCQQKRVFVDAGAHIGIWSKTLAPHFEAVNAFEPVIRHQQCLRLNTPENVFLYPVALGEQFKTSFVNALNTNSGCSHIDNTGQPVIVAPLDSFGLVDVDLLKIDTEGFELFVLLGARETIDRCKPVIVIENYGWAARYGYEWEQAARILKTLGYYQEYRDEDTKEEIWLPSL